MNLLNLSKTLLKLSKTLLKLSKTLLKLSKTLLKLSKTLLKLSKTLLKLSKTLLKLSKTLQSKKRGRNAFCRTCQIPEYVNVLLNFNKYNVNYVYFKYLFMFLPKNVSLLSSIYDNDKLFPNVANTWSGIQGCQSSRIIIVSSYLSFLI